VQNNYSLLPSVTFTRLNNIYTSSGTRGAPEAGGGGWGNGSRTAAPPEPKFKNTFCIKDDIKHFMWFTFRPESATEFD